MALSIRRRRTDRGFELEDAIDGTSLILTCRLPKEVYLGVEGSKRFGEALLDGFEQLKTELSRHGNHGMVFRGYDIPVKLFNGQKLKFTFRSNTALNRTSLERHIRSLIARPCAKLIAEAQDPQVRQAWRAEQAAIRAWKSGQVEAVPKDAEYWSLCAELRDDPPSSENIWKTEKPSGTMDDIAVLLGQAEVIDDLETAPIAVLFDDPVLTHLD